MLINRLAYLLISGSLAFFLWTGIDLTNADLGRHLKTGELINLYGLHAPLLHANFYSYTEPSFPVINHHWVSGWIFYKIFQLTGFTGLSVFYFVLCLIGVLLIFDVARKQSNTAISLFSYLWFLPLIAARQEIRPEVFSFVLAAFSFWFLFNYRQKKIKDIWLWVLPFIMLVWVNLHVYFFLGYFFLGVFFLDFLIAKDYKKAKQIVIVGLVSGLAGLISPFGLAGLIYPLNIFQNYGYLLVENMSIPFLEKWGMQNFHFSIIKISIILFMIFTFFQIKNKKMKWFLFLPGVFFAVLAWTGLRNHNLFGLFIWPMFAYSLFQFKSWTKYAAIIILLVFGLSREYSHFLNWPRLGLCSNTVAAEFIKQNNIPGPIFNNYDVGGYLIYKLYPEYQVFVDNRPEAYSVEFFQKEYIPMQSQDTAWQEQLGKDNFNLIVFNYHDLTPWAQQFLLKRVKDPLWVPVYVDQTMLVLVKNTKLNQSVIKKHALPRSMFGTK